MASLATHLEQLGMIVRLRTPAGSIWRVHDIMSDEGVLATLPREADVWAWLVERGHVTEAELAGSVFGWSEPRDAGVDPWRVSRSEALHALLHLHSYGADAYVEHEGDTGLWVGLVSMGDELAFARRVESIVELLHGFGLHAKQVRREGRVIGLRVLDHIEPARQVA